MGWIKAEIDDDYHDRLRTVVENSDARTDVIVGNMVQKYMDNNDIEVDE